MPRNVQNILLDTSLDLGWVLEIILCDIREEGLKIHAIVAPILQILIIEVQNGYQKLFMCIVVFDIKQILKKLLCVIRKAKVLQLFHIF